MPRDKEEKPAFAEASAGEKDKPKVMLDAVVEEVPAATVEQLVNVPEVTMPVEVTRVEGGSGKWTWVWAVVGLVLGIAVGGGAGYMIWGNKQETNVVPQVQKAEPTKVVPTPTAAAEVKRSELKVKVLNGSVVGGAAGKAKGLLESLGYKDVATGNADRSNYTQTEVTAVKDAYWQTVKTDLGSKYEVASESGKAELGEFDVVVILGGI